MGDVGYKKPPLHRAIKKGEVRNPQGGRAHNPELRALKRLTHAEVAEIGSLVVEKNLDALKLIIEDGKSNPDSKHSTLKVWMATIAAKGIQKGDASALDTLLNRITGKVKERIELSGNDGGPIAYSDMTDADLEEKTAKIMNRLITAGEAAIKTGKDDEPSGKD